MASAKMYDYYRLQAEKVLEARGISFVKVCTPTEEINKHLLVFYGDIHIVLHLHEGTFLVKGCGEHSLPRKVRKRGGGGVQGVVCRIEALKKFFEHRRRCVNGEKKKRSKKDKALEKAYNKETEVSMMYKLQEAEKLYKQGGYSMSKSARMFKLDYTTFKEFLTTDKFKVGNQRKIV